MHKAKKEIHIGDSKINNKISVMNKKRRGPN